MKIFYAVSISFLFAFNSFAQDSDSLINKGDKYYFYPIPDSLKGKHYNFISASVGYNLPFSGEYYHAASAVQSTGNIETVKHFSLGTGLSFSISIGQQIGKNFEVEVNYLYHTTRPFTSEIRREDFGVSSVSTTKLTSHASIFSPSVTILSGQGRVRVFAKGSFMFGICGAKYDEEDITVDTSSSIIGNQITELKGGTFLGFGAGFGCLVNLSKYFQLAPAINFISASYVPGRSEITKDVVNGVDMLPSISAWGKKTEFVNSATRPYNANLPAQATKYSMPYSSVGLSLAIRYRF
jgi:hypothetical protein